MNRSKIFPVKPVSDWVIIERLNIESVAQKKAKKSGIVMPDSSISPKNILDLEKRKAEELATYEGAEKQLLGMWDENPNQAIVMAVGEGRDIGDGVLIKPVVKVGDHVFYRGKSGEPVIVNKKLYWMVKDYDIFGTIPAEVNIK